jgi:2OG-Fe(II) oxygenase superfamily
MVSRMTETVGAVGTSVTEEYRDFIGIYPGALSREDCKKIIEAADRFFKTSPKEHITAGAAQTPFLEFTRLDYSLNATIHLPNAGSMVDAALGRCILKYAAQYFVTRQIKASTKEVKLQKTPPRGGYHFWHCENFNKETGDRALAWMIYLNDIPEGEGETEFIWQKLRVQPEAGKCLIWPTQFTHTHRGNPVYSTTKYIATGWYTYDW